DRILLDPPRRRGQSVVQIRVQGGRHGGGNGRFEASPGLGQRLTNSNRNLFPVRTGAIAQTRLKRLVELPLEKSLLDDRLQCRRKVLNSHSDVLCFCNTADQKEALFRSGA